MSTKLQPALLGGAFMGMLSALPIVSAGNLCCCLWVVVGGALAAYLMLRNYPEQNAIGDGAVVGLLAGIFGSVVSVLVSLPINYLMAPLHRRLLDRFMTNAQDVPPQMRDFIESYAANVGGLLVWFLIMLFVGTIFSIVGGMLGVVLFKRSVPPPAGTTDRLPPPL